MSKKILITIIIIGIPIAYYLISPFWRNIKINEVSPLIEDNLEKMDTKMMEQFKKQVETAKDNTIQTDDPMSSLARVLAKGEFKPRAHDVEGQALLIEKDAEKVLRFENFKTINGPNLHIYLGSELNNKDFIDLGEIKATEGNINYTIPSRTDTGKYNKVMVWCVPFSVLFSYAELK